MGLWLAQLTYMISHSQDMTKADLKVKYEEKYLDFILCETGLWFCLEICSENSNAGNRGEPSLTTEELSEMIFQWKNLSFNS